MNIEKLICYEDQNILAIDKPQGIATTPGNIPDIITGVFTYYPELKQIKGYKEGEGGLLNRLDNETGGLILIAKNQKSFDYFSKQMKEQLVTKYYYAICNIIRDDFKDKGTINYPIFHNKVDNSKMVCFIEKDYQNNKLYKKLARGKPQISETDYFVLKRNKDYAFVEAIIKKGIRHQIRLHLSSIGLPIVGDKLYKESTGFSVNLENEKYHLLFCYKVKLILMNGKEINIFSKINFNIFLEKYLPD